MMKLFNSLTQREAEFMPQQPGVVTIYACGPTVYDFPHIGNLRTFLFGDILCRALRRAGLEVREVMNITDVDDKTIARSLREGVSLQEYTQRYTDYFLEDLKTLRIEPAWKYPKATEHIPQMIQIVQALMDKGHAYVSEGSVYFKLDSFPRYGKLSGLTAEQRGAERLSRLDADEYDRENAQDFVLWKAAREGEPSWDSPWGPGRPGWHIECSAMSMEYLGETLDIHVGGVDLLFPHHENEIAQSEAATGKPFVRWWMHGEHLLVDGLKMAKSLGNFYTLRDLLDRGIDPMAVRHQLLTAHYRHQLNFTVEGLEQSTQALKRLWDFVDRLAELQPAEEGNALVASAVARAQESFGAALDDDLNVPGAMGSVFELMREVNTPLQEGHLDAANVAAIQGFLEDADSVLGFIAHERQALDGDIEALIGERNQARRDRNFARADEIRDQLLADGIVLEDGPQGTRWRRE
ncbi:MAG: cysteine--tRNA ligase [Armatimonadetes bacterium]|nr:cysteine--tRNA ligase [Armatimonadota bacterium]